MRVIAKAYGDEPLDREIVEANQTHCFIVNPAAVKTASTSGARPIGFRRETVFTFDANLYAQLRAAYDSGSLVALGRLWAEANPLGAQAVPADQERDKVC